MVYRHKYDTLCLIFLVEFHKTYTQKIDTHSYLDGLSISSLSTVNSELNDSSSKCLHFNMPSWNCSSGIMYLVPASWEASLGWLERRSLLGEDAGDSDLLAATCEWFGNSFLTAMSFRMSTASCLKLSFQSLRKTCHKKLQCYIRHN